MTSKDLIKFPEGTQARCNRNDCPGSREPQSLPRDIEGWRENSNAYRLREMCVLPCGHLDGHWVFLSDNPQKNEKGYSVVWGGDPAASGIWDNETNKQIVSDWGLRKWHNTTAANVAQWSPKSIASLAKRHGELR